MIVMALSSQACIRNEGPLTEVLPSKEELRTAIYLETSGRQPHSTILQTQQQKLVNISKSGNFGSAGLFSMCAERNLIDSNSDWQAVGDLLVGHADDLPTRVNIFSKDKTTYRSKLQGISIANGLRLSEDRCALESLIHMDDEACKFRMLDCSDSQDAIVSPELLHFTLHQCTLARDLDLGIRLHCFIAKIGLETTSFMGSQLIHMYSSFELLLEAGQVFSKLLFPDAFSWSEIISAHGKVGQTNKAMLLYYQMLKLDVEPDGHVYVATLNACANAGNIGECRKVHSHIIAAGFELDDFVSGTLIDVYTKSGCLQEACTQFAKLPTQNAITWSVLITGYTQHGLGEVALQIFHRMHQQGLEPNQFAFACILKTCTSINALDQGTLVHNHIIQSGYEDDIVIGNSLIDMYVKCGSLDMAHSLFMKMPYRNLITYSTLIAGYTQHGHNMEAFNLFKQMQVHGFEPDLFAFTCLLKACLNAADLMQGRQIHCDIIERGWESDMHISSILIEFYTEYECLQDAWIIFSRVPHCDVITWNVLMSGFALNGDNEGAWTIFEQFQRESPIIDSSSFVCVLKACSGSITLAKIQDLHCDAISSGCELHLTVGCAFIDIYLKWGSLLDAQMVFYRLPYPDVVAWTALIAGYAQLGYIKGALDLLTQMHSAGIEPNDVTFNGIVKACSSSLDQEHGRLIHAETVRSGLEMNSFVGNALVDMYSKCGGLSDAKILFNRLLLQDVVSWTTLVGGYAEFGDNQEALNIYQQMQQACVEPNQATYVSILKACSNASAIDDRKLIHSNVIEYGLQADVMIGNTLVNVYGECGSLDDASMIFNRMPMKDTITWSSLIGGYAKHGYGQEALQIFHQMQHENLEPSHSTFVHVLKACSSSMAMEYGRGIHVCLLERGWDSDVFMSSSLIDMYARCGNLSDAGMVFERSIARDGVLWSSMVAGYAQHSDYKLASLYFDRMRQEGLVPDKVTFTSLLSACSRVGLIEEGCLLLRSMSVDYGVAPDMEHYNALADILARTGCLNTAEDLLESIPFRLNLVGWTSLLGSCSKLVDVNVGRRCFKHMLTKDPNNAVGYVLMSRLYMRADMPDAAREVEKARQGADIRKLVARASIEVDKQVHVFSVGDTSHPCNDEILAKVKSLNIQARAEGYRPQLDLLFHSISDKEKEDYLCGHCEKLAIAFGLISTPLGSSIRIAKNLRVCTDCHSSTEKISKVEKREIIVSDSYCVHHFRDGECSCKDYW